jgi:poly(3-hydroxybutyrate) depolymerase
MNPIRIAVALVTVLVSRSQAPAATDDYAVALKAAGANRTQLEQAVERAPDAQRDSMRWLIEHMPSVDLSRATSEFLLANTAQAYEAWQSAPWHDRVDEALFRDAILPFACIDEPRDEWRTLLREKCLPMVKGITSPALAAAKINRELFPLVGVKYSTKRKRADQSPAESIESGLASCTGLSILLIDACRSVGIPARFVGIPMWNDGSGNHSWVEVWDGGWHFTGAAEATGDELDKGWFTERAASARRDEPMHAIYAVTWNDSPTLFPTAWREPGEPDDGSVRAINVTDRYTGTGAKVPDGMAPVRVRVLSSAGRVARHVRIVDDAGALLFQGMTRDDGFDSNDHLTALLPIGAAVLVTTDGAAPAPVSVSANTPIVDLRVVGSSEALAALERFLRTHAFAEAIDQSFASVPLTKADAAAALTLLWKRLVTLERAPRAKELESGSITVAGTTMPIWFKEYGPKPVGGHSLFISMHGGGGAPKEVNDKQWQNQQRLYEPAEGIYVAPRAPTDTWNLWHQEHIDALFSRLIEDMVIVQGVNPDRVYLTGYSAGGDGVYQLAPRMADRFAAVAMMAGHPNETRPDGLRNLPFALHMGANDAPFDRNKVAAQWKVLLADLAASDPGGYPHLVKIHEGKGHWMDRQDASAIAWMAQHTRQDHPLRVVWLQDDVTHKRFYWLRAPQPKERVRVAATRTGQHFSVELGEGAGPLSLLLNDGLCDLNHPIAIRVANGPEHTVSVQRTIAALARSLQERADPAMAYSAEVPVP